MLSREARSEVEQRRERPALAPVASIRPVEERRVAAWVGKSVVFKGELTSSEDITVDGRVEGSIEVRDHNLTVGPDAEIHADIVAKTVTVIGNINGSIIAHDKVEIRETGSILGDIQSPRLAMADGAVLRGRVETSNRRTELGGQIREVPA